ncbi:alpha/beta hydrolase [Bdellovibrionota bacterium FG-2]
MHADAPSEPRPKGGRKKSHFEENSDGFHPPISHGYVKSFDGTKLFYSIEGKGPPLIFCYGLICSSLHWTYQIEHFRKNYRTIWFDYRGHHNSETPKNFSSLTLESISRDLGVLMDELELKESVLLGHSMGVNVVLEFYRQQPKKVLGMVLANGTAKKPLETMFRHNALETGFSLMRRLHKISPSLVSKIWKTQKQNPIARTFVSFGGFNPHLTPRADIELYIDQVADMDPAILLQLIDSYDSYDATAWLHTIQAPTLVIAGEQDNIIPIEQQELMHQLIPDCRLEVIRHGSHCPQMDLPDLVNAKIDRFLGDISYELKPNPLKETASQSTARHQAPGPARIS